MTSKTPKLWPASFPGQGDEDQRESMEVKDWKSRHVKAPGEHEQWVQIKGKYALISVPTGTIKKMVNK